MHLKMMSFLEDFSVANKLRMNAQSTSYYLSAISDWAVMAGS